jgi:uridine kinase
MRYSSLHEITARIKKFPDPCLIAIDGLPCSGKSTLAEQLKNDLGLACLYLDDFMLPRKDWPVPCPPAFPFQYMRYTQFMTAVQTLAKTGNCRFHPFEWNTGRVAQAEKVLSLDKPIIVEGVSTLHPNLLPYYALRIFVDSDKQTLAQALSVREQGSRIRNWHDLFLPSIELYMVTDPKKRADIFFAGRGASIKISENHTLS